MVNWIALAALVASSLFYSRELPELVWGLWATSIICGWTVVLAAIVRAYGFIGRVLYEGERNEKMKGEMTLKNISLLLVIGTLGIFALSGFILFHFTFFHAIHAAILSGLIPPPGISKHAFDGTPLSASFIGAVRDLGFRYYDIILASLLVRWEELFKRNLIQNCSGIYGSVMRMHFFILIGGFLTLLLSSFGVVLEKVLYFVLLFFFFSPWTAGLEKIDVLDAEVKPKVPDGEDPEKNVK